MKKQNGITLVALVITIIVLLILAGVSISLALGQNGVLNRASQAVDANNLGSAKEDVSNAAYAAITEYWGDWAKNNQVHKYSYFTKAKLEANLNNGTLDTYSDPTADGEISVVYKFKDSGKNGTTGAGYDVTIDTRDGSVKTVTAK